MTNDLIALADTAIQGLDLERATPDQMRQAIEFVDALKARTKQLGDAFEAAAIAWLQFHGDLTVGDNRYYVGTTKRVRCNDPAATLDALLTASDGSVEAIVQALKADPFKPGTTKTLLGEPLFDKHFQTIVIPDLKTGKPLRRVLKANPKFQKGDVNEEA